MMVLVACEESQVVCKAFRAKGHEAYSCDLQACSGGHAEWHLQMDCFKAWELLQPELSIWFPPCTHLSSSGAVYWPQKQADGRQDEAINFVLEIASLPGKKAIENPTGILSTKWRKPDQIIHPYHFGDPYMKRTCLWLDRLPKLSFTNIVEPTQHWHSGSTRGGKKKDGTRTPSKLPALKSGSLQRSKTFPGIAQAMADQWG